MKTAIKLSWMLILAILIPAVARAVPVQITFEGVVFSSRDDTNIFGSGTGMDTIVGATAKSIFIFDTDDIPTTDANPNSHITDYRDGTDWVKATTFINTSTTDLIFTDDSIPTPDFYQDRLYIQDDDLIGGSLEYLHLLSYGRDWSPDEALNQSVTFWDSDTGVDSISSNDPIAALNLMDPALWGNSAGLLEYVTHPDATTIVASWAQFNISSVDITLTAVPEPSTVILFGVGLVALGLRYRRRT